ncbi:DNA-processing protein DprA [Conchiformibius steedae DSM 2580]|uniref:DNA-processing protein DprA n=1 Tax=Conchiformibius steedae DSM 2580 TaxID=1121352 RepID=A0AAE9L106_9NEIS|nr:DNA-processing protein DprA [Conchiformibius steedae]QMT33734.1 DNA-protecting protein DprA [Conchiformibius steedae]URD68395.1 DNA-processing protein DprA [Conchiformibius steedae DSM 2580]
MNESERHAWLQLALTPHIGAESFLRLLKHYGSAAAALAAPAAQVAQIARYGKRAAAAWHTRADEARAAADDALQWEQQAACRLLLLGDADYPPLLGEGMTPPPLLFLRGNADLLGRAAVAIVGSRHCTPQAARIARDFAQALSEQGITVISGMASGIDAAAHQGALQGSGSTIAVWGTGIDRVYPPAHRNLAHQIAEQGLIVSEFPLGTKPLAGNFPRRNRIIAALGVATLVVEAALESGSLITARLAAEMGRDVMAVPGSIDNPHSKGCHKLIKDGAKLVENLDDILQECTALGGKALPRPIQAICQLPRQQKETLTLIPTPTESHTDTPDPQHPWLAAVGYDPFHPDTLAEQLRLPAADIHAQLLEWELEGLLAALSGGRYQRIR